MSRDAVMVDKVVIAKLAAIYLFRPFFKGSGVSKKTESPYSAMKRCIPGVSESMLCITLRDPLI